MIPCQFRAWFLAQLPMVLPAKLKFPDLYVKFLSFFSFLNFAIVPRFLRLECEMRVDHYSQVYFMTLVPLLLIALELSCFGVHWLYTRDEAAKNQLPASYFGYFLAGTYLIYPSVSTTLFQTLRCEVFDTPEYEGDEHVDSYLRADPRLKCGDGDLSDLESGHGFHWDSEYTFMWWYSVSFTLVYPIGIPTLYFVLLYTNRDLIAPTPAIPADGQRTEPIVAAQLRLREANAPRIAHLGFLIDSYEPGRMYFEVVECVRKLMLTGMLTFFFPETPSQVRARALF